jgi:hypothetical protein
VAFVWIHELLVTRGTSTPLSLTSYSKRVPQSAAAGMVTPGVIGLHPLSGGRSRGSETIPETEHVCGGVIQIQERDR